MEYIDDQESVRPFVVSALSVVFLCLSSIAVFNWWADPFAAFNHPARPGINDHLSQVSFYESPRDQQFSWLVQRGKQARGHDILLGASQTLFGMDTCSYPSLQRLGLFGLSEGEADEFLEQTKSRISPNARLYVNLTYAGRDLPAKEDRGIKFLWRNLLSGETTMISFRNLLESKRATLPICAAAPFPRELQRGYNKGVFNDLRQSMSDPDQSVSKLFSTLAKVCRETDAQIRLFTLPVNFDSSIANEVYANFKNQRRIVISAKQDLEREVPNCRVSFVDLATEYTAENLKRGPPQADWFDTTHFKPSIGNRFLTRIMEAPTQ